MVTVKKYGRPSCLQPVHAGVAYRPLHEGEEVLFDPDIRNENPKFTTPEVYAKYYDCYEQLAAFAKEMGRPMNEICVNWLRQKEEVTAIIGGASSVKQLEGNIHAMTWDIQPDEMAKINEIIEPFREL